MDTTNSNSDHSQNMVGGNPEKSMANPPRSFFGEPVPLTPGELAKLLAIKNMKRRIVICLSSVLIVLVSIWFWRLHNSNLKSSRPDPVALEQAARDHPDDIESQLAWGEYLVKTKQLEDAFPIVEQAKHLSPNDSRPYALMGMAAVIAHRESEARVLLNLSLQHNPSDVNALRTLANLDAQQHHLNPAIKGFERLVQINPKDADAWQRLGLLFIGARENYRSFDALSHAAALAPNDMMTQRSFGSMQLQSGRLSDARKTFQIVLAHDPNDQQALSGLASVFMQLDPTVHGLATAETYATSALKFSPSALNYRIRGQIRQLQHNFTAAIDDLNTSIRLEPEHRATYVLLSQCYASAGKPELAKKASLSYELLTEKKLSRDRAILSRKKVTK